MEVYNKDGLVVHISDVMEGVDAEFLVAAGHDGLAVERIVTNTATIAWDFVTDGQAKASVIAAAIDNTYLAQMPTMTVKGNDTGGLAAPQDLTQLELTAMVNLATSTTKGVIPPISGVVTQFLAGDLTWRVPAGGGGGGAPIDAEYLVAIGHAGLSAERLITDTATIGWTLTAGSGVATAAVKTDSITNSMLKTMPSTSVKVNETATNPAAPTDLQATVLGHVLQRATSTLTWGLIGANSVVDGSMTFAKVQDIATNRLLGRATASSGDVEQLLLSVVNPNPLQFIASPPSLGFNPATLLDNNARVSVRLNSGAGADTAVYTRRRLNFIEGLNCDLQLSETVGTEEVNVVISATGSAVVPAGLKEDINVVGPNEWQIVAGKVGEPELANQGVTLPKLVHATAGKLLFGRGDNGTGAWQEIALDPATLAMSAGTVSPPTPPTLSVIGGGGGGGSITPGIHGDIDVVTLANWQILANVVTNLELEDMPSLTVKGNNTGSSGDPMNLTMPQLVAMLPLFGTAISETTPGLVPSSSPPTVPPAPLRYLREDRAWMVPPSFAGGANTQVQFNNLGALAGNAALTFAGTTLTATNATVTGELTVSNSGLHLLEAGASPAQDLIIRSGSILSQDRTLTLTTGDLNRNITFASTTAPGDLTIGTTAAGNTTVSGFNSGDVTLAGTPTYLTMAAGQILTRNLIEPHLHIKGPTGAALGIPSGIGDLGDRILMWDNTSGTAAWLAIGTNLAIDTATNTLSAAGGGGGGGLEWGVKEDIDVVDDTHWQIMNNVVTNSEMQDMSPLTIKGNNTLSSGDPHDLSIYEVVHMLPLFGSSMDGANPQTYPGVVPPYPLFDGGINKFLCADRTWKVPPGAGGNASIGSAGRVQLSGGTTGGIPNPLLSDQHIHFGTSTGTGGGTGGTHLFVQNINVAEVGTTGAFATVGKLTVPNTGLRLLDISAAPTFTANQALVITPGSLLTADRFLTLTTGDADRTINLGSNLTIPADPNDNRILFWNEATNAHAYLDIDATLQITGTSPPTLSAVGGGGTTPALPVNSVQYNAGSTPNVFGGNAAFTFDGTTASITTANITTGTFSNTGLHILEPGVGTFDLILAPIDNLTADRTLSIGMGTTQASRTVTFNGDTILSGTNSGDQTIALTGDVEGTGTGSFATTVKKVSTEFAISGDIAGAIGGNTNNYNPSGFSTATVLRLTPSSTWNLTGLAGGVDGRIIIIHNVGAFDLVLTNQDGASSAANRFDFGANLTLPSRQSVILWYDADALVLRWKKLADTIQGSGSALITLGGDLLGTATPPATLFAQIQPNVVGNTELALSTVSMCVKGNPTTTTAAAFQDVGGGIANNVLRCDNAGTAFAWGALNLAGGANAITGDLPFANLAQSTAASQLLGRGSASGLGDWQPITLATNMAMAGTTLNAKSTVRINSGGPILEQKRLNFIPGSANLTILAAADTGNDEIDITIDATGGGGGAVTLTGDVTGTGTGTVPTTAVSASTTWARPGDLTASLTANQNDYNPTGFSTSPGCSVVRISSDASRTITSVVPGATPDGRIVTWTNVGSFNVVFEHASASGTAVNRFDIGSSITLLPDQTVTFRYDATDTRWRLQSSSGRTGAPVNALQFNNAGAFDGTTNAADSTTNGMYWNQANVCLDVVNTDIRQITGAEVNPWFVIPSNPTGTGAKELRFGPGGASATLDCGIRRFSAGRLEINGDLSTTAGRGVILPFHTSIETSDDDFTTPTDGQIVVSTIPEDGKPGLYFRAVTGTPPAETWWRINADHATIGSTPTALATQQITFSVGNGVNPIVAGQVVTTRIRLGYACTILGWSIIASTAPASTATLHVNRFNGGGTPVITSDITGTAPPTLTSIQGVASSSTTLTGWTTSLNQGDTLALEVVSASGCTYMCLTLSVRRT